MWDKLYQKWVVERERERKMMFIVAKFLLVFIIEGTNIKLIAIENRKKWGRIDEL